LTQGPVSTPNTALGSCLLPAMARTLVRAALGAALLAVAATQEVSRQVPGTSVPHGADATAAERLGGPAVVEHRRLETADDTTTPPQVESMTSILKTVSDAIDTQLRAQRYPWINAVIALFVGLIMVKNGELVFEWLVVGTVFVFAMPVAINEVTVFLGLSAGDPLRMLVGVEVGAAMAYAAYKGIHGMMMLIAFVFGTFVAYGLQQSLEHVSHSALDHTFLFALYSVVVAGSMVMVRYGKHSGVLAVVSSIPGGLLVSSSLCYFVTLAAATYPVHFNKIAPGLMPAVPGVWVDFVTLLVYGGKDFGVLVGRSFHGIPADRIAGCSLWLLVSGIGAFRQVRAISQRGNAKANQTKPSLKKPLLSGP